MGAICSYKAGGGTASVKDVDGKQGIVTGYFADFNTVDSDGDIIRPGAFTKTISEMGPNGTGRIKHLQNHNTSQPLGKITTLREDAKGLYYESQLAKHALGMDFLLMVEGGLITEHSIGYRTMKRNQLQDYDGYMKNPAGGWYELTQLQLWEGSSLTAWGANENTPLTGLKGTISQQDAAARMEAIDKFCRSTKATDSTIQFLLTEYKQLLLLVTDTTQPGSTGNTTAPGNHEKALAALRSFNKQFKTS